MLWVWQALAEAPPPPPPPAAVTSIGSSSKNTGIVIGIAVGTALAVLGQFCFFLLSVLKLCFCQVPALAWLC